MQEYAAPILLFVGLSTLLAGAMLGVGWLLGPRISGPVKRMPYESGMDPVHAARRRFDVRFHVVAIVFLVFDVELLFLYPWAVANRLPEGFAAAAGGDLGAGRWLLFGELIWFLGLLTAGFIYAWRKGVFRWR